LITPPPQLRRTAIVRSQATARKILARTRSPTLSTIGRVLRRPAACSVHLPHFVYYWTWQRKPACRFRLSMRSDATARRWQSA